MARLARVEVFAPDEVAIVHVMNRVVRRCFLLGNDPVTGKNYDHRKVWIEDLLKRFASQLKAEVKYEVAERPTYTHVELPASDFRSKVDVKFG